jgi:hypothetical protein
MFNLTNEIKKCTCGDISGKMLNDVDAQYTGNAGLFILNGSVQEILNALRNMDNEEYNKVILNPVDQNDTVIFHKLT